MYAGGGGRVQRDHREVCEVVPVRDHTPNTTCRDKIKKKHKHMEEPSRPCLAQIPASGPHVQSSSSETHRTADDLRVQVRVPRSNEEDCPFAPAPERPRANHFNFREMHPPWGALDSPKTGPTRILNLPLNSVPVVKGEGWQGPIARTLGDQEGDVASLKTGPRRFPAVHVRVHSKPGVKPDTRGKGFGLYWGPSQN